METAFLIPIGAATEEIHGISHLFEHLLIRSILNYRESITGYTTEDYIIFLCNGLSSVEFLNLINRIAPNEEGFLLEKMLIQEEVKGNDSNDSENFFRKVWKDTIYMASPLGNVASIERITREDMMRFKERILSDQIYCYDSYENVTIINNENSKMKNIYPLGFTYLGPAQIIFKKKSYEIFYFEGRPERLYLLERILKIKNPDKLVQLSEKRKRCALILESKSNFPENENEINNLIPGALSSIMEDVSSIKSNFNERAINELESAFFYGDRWKNRIDTLLSTQSHETLNIIDILSPQSGVYYG